MAMSNQYDSSDLLLSGVTTVSQPSINNAMQDVASGYDADDEADLLSHVSETTEFTESDSDLEGDSDIMSSLTTPEEPLSPIGLEGLGDSTENNAVQDTEGLLAAPVSPPEGLAEGDSGSSSSSPVSAHLDESGGTTNLRRRRIFVETESAKRARLEI